MPNNSVFSYNRIGSTSTGSGGGDRGGTWRFGGLLLYNKFINCYRIRPKSQSISIKIQ